MITVSPWNLCKMWSPTCNLVFKPQGTVLRAPRTSKALFIGGQPTSFPRFMMGTDLVTSHKSVSQSIYGSIQIIFPNNSIQNTFKPWKFTIYKLLAAFFLVNSPFSHGFLCCFLGCLGRNRRDFPGSIVASLRGGLSDVAGLWAGPSLMG